MAELDLLQAWYEHGRRKKRRFTGIIRSATQKKHVRGLKTVFDHRVRKHYQKFRRPVHLQGLFSWQQAAQDLHSAGYALDGPVHSGTIACERLWALMSGMIPVSARRISPAWFSWISKLCFVRCCALHARRKKTLPAWARGDVLLAQRLSTLSTDFAALLAEMHSDHVARADQARETLAALISSDERLQQAIRSTD